MFSLNKFTTLIELIKAFPDEQSCINHLENIIWDGGVPVSPFDPTSKVYKIKDRYQCKNTKKYFNVKHGTIFENSKISLINWFIAIFLISSNKKGISTYQLGKDLGLSQKSSWFLLQRIRNAMKQEIELNGLIQVDETFVGGKNKNRHHDKKVEFSQGRSFKDKVPVLGILDSNNKVKCFVIPDTSAKSLHPILEDNVQKESIIISDEWGGYNGIEKNFERYIVDHSKKEYVNQNGFTTNGIENCWTHFKRMWVSTYSGRIAKKHLQKYADEFSFRYNTIPCELSDRFYLLLGQTKGRRLTYKNLIK